MNNKGKRPVLYTWFLAVAYSLNLIPEVSFIGSPHSYVRNAVSENCNTNSDKQASLKPKCRLQRANSTSVPIRKLTHLDSANILDSVKREINSHNIYEPYPIYQAKVWSVNIVTPKIVKTFFITLKSWNVLETRTDSVLWQCKFCSSDPEIVTRLHDNDTQYFSL